jgi:hypothetical protein
MLLLLLAGIGASGCATHRAYDGPERPRESVALIEPVPSRTHELYLSAIDGQTLAPWVVRAELLPGEHVIEATLVLRLRGRRVIADHPLRFEAVQGHTYRVDGGWDLYGPRLWITDTETGKTLDEALTLPKDLPPVGMRDY